jgi:hypothetical protein
MSLYGDLPPIEGEKDTPDISSGWAKPKLNNITRKPPKEEKKKLNVVLNSSSQPKPQSSSQPAPTPAPAQSQYTHPSPVASSGKFAPFKPRQASKPISSSAAPFVPVPLTPIPEPNLQISLLTETVVRKKINDPIVLKFDQENSNARENDQLDDSRRATYDCSDPYDPSKPNDYLKYCEERFEKKRLKQMDQDNRKAIDEAERLRDAVEKERAKAMKEGDLARVQASLAGSGRGRGRGMTNLPAWLTDSLKSDSSAESHGTNSQFGQFDDADSSMRKRKPSFDSSYS